jgi:hypothetical protein
MAASRMKRGQQKRGLGAFRSALKTASSDQNEFRKLSFQNDAEVTLQRFPHLSPLHATTRKARVPLFWSESIQQRNKTYKLLCANRPGFQEWNE